MRLGIKQFTSIAALTALEAFRQPVTLLLTASSIAFVAVLPIILTQTMGDAERLVRDSALAMMFVAGLVLGGFSACAALSRDIRKGTAAAVLSKPVSRALFFLAKFAGVSIALVTFSALMTIATLLSARTAVLDFQPDWWGIGPLLLALVLAFAAAGTHHYFARGPFASRAFAYLVAAVVIALLVSCFARGAEPGARFGAALSWRIVPAALLICMATLNLAAMSVSLATRLDVVPVLTICSIVFMLGLISDYLVGHAAGSNSVARVILDLLPNAQHFWAVDALSRDGIPALYLLRAANYAALYLAAILCAGIFAFRRMEVK